MANLELTKKELAALEALIDLATQKTRPLILGAHDAPLRRIAVKLGVIAPDELEEDRHG